MLGDDLMKLRHYFRKINAEKRLITLFCGILCFFYLMNAYTYIETLSVVVEKFIKNEDVNIAKKKEQLSFMVQENIWRKYDFINLNGLAHNLLGQREMNDVYKLDNGYVADTIPYINTSAFAKSLVALHNQLSVRGIDMLYVQAPCKSDPAQNLFPPSIHDYSNKNADEFLQIIVNANIPVLDLRAEIRKDNIDFYSLFYQTDHHWTSQTAFWAFQKIAERMKDTFEVPIDSSITDINQYKITTYKNLFPGYYVNRTGKYYAGLDDISLIIPSFHTKLSIQIPKLGVEKEGTFGEILVNKEALQEQVSYNRYYVYLGTNDSLTINNHLLGNEKKIVIVKDSFAIPVIPYFSLAFKQVEVIDLRYSNHNSLIDSIDEIKPDIVLFLYNASAYEIDNFFNFQPTE